MKDNMNDKDLDKKVMLEKTRLSRLKHNSGILYDRYSFQQCWKVQIHNECSEPSPLDEVRSDDHFVRISYPSWVICGEWSVCSVKLEDYRRSISGRIVNIISFERWKNGLGERAPKHNAKTQLLKNLPAPCDADNPLLLADSQETSASLSQCLR